MHNAPKSHGSQKALSPDQLNITATGQHISIMEQGGVYVAVFSGSYENPSLNINQIVPSNTVSILWQIPQYLLITLAEVLFAISGNEFAYSQAPPSMKAVVYALWMCTGAIGDLIIIVIALFDIFEDIAMQCFVYAGAMLVVIIIFALMAIFYYEYKIYSVDENEEKTQLLNEENNEMVVETSA
uniref:Peptide transporter n=1 Tax=Panagrolaimus sp. ES5 TaxID=591445 RepID=A0AC34GXK0_9BILA